MSKKTLILSKKQLDEICGGDSSYLDGLTDSPDMSGHEFAKEVSSDGNVDYGYANATKTDDVADDMTNGWGDLKNYGIDRRGPITVREWKEIYLEEKEHGNARLKNMEFGAQNGQEGKSYGATKTALSRLNTAQETMKTGATQDVKDKAAQTVQRMENNWGGIGVAATQYNAAKSGDKTVQGGMPVGQKRKPKTPKGLNGVFV